MTQNITLTFECDDADEAQALLVIYELVHAQYKDGYSASFSLRELPNVLHHLTDIICDRLNGTAWCDDTGVSFTFTPAQAQFIANIVNANGGRRESLARSRQ